MNKREFILTTISGVIGVLVGASTQLVIPYFLDKKLSDETIDIFFRKEVNNGNVGILISNNSDHSLDVTEISIQGSVSENIDLGIFVEPSQVYILDENKKAKADNIKNNNGSFYANFKTRNTLKPGERDLVNINFISPKISDITVKNVKLKSPNGKYLSLDGEF